MRFEYHNPTRIIFGSGSTVRLADSVPADARIMLFYGGGSIKRNGLYETVIAALGARIACEFSGITANPDYERILAAREQMRANACDFILAVGGGSVVDAAKYLAIIADIDSDDPWSADLAAVPEETSTQIGVVLTLPATGSESNTVSVISNRRLGLKVPFSHPRAYPRFAILDPDHMKSLERRQLQNGVVDAITHVMEQYLTYPVNAPIHYGISEAILETLFHWGPILVEQQTAEARENVMLGANLALNGLIGAGVPQDWATHMIGHAITALYGVDHARSLTMVLPAQLLQRLAQKQDLLARFGRRIWGLTGDDDAAIARSAIAKTVAFFQQMECPINLESAGIPASAADRIIEHIASAGQLPLGEHRDLNEPELRDILTRAYDYMPEAN